MLDPVGKRGSSVESSVTLSLYFPGKEIIAFWFAFDALFIEHRADRVSLRGDERQLSLASPILVTAINRRPRGKAKSHILWKDMDDKFHEWGGNQGTSATFWTEFVTHARA